MLPQYSKVGYLCDPGTIRILILPTVVRMARMFADHYKHLLAEAQPRTNSANWSGFASFTRLVTFVFATNLPEWNLVKTKCLREKRSNPKICFKIFLSIWRGLKFFKSVIWYSFDNLTFPCCPSTPCHTQTVYGMRGGWTAVKAPLSVQSHYSNWIRLHLPIRERCPHVGLLLMIQG